jgi:hydroxypyruvate reductase
VGAGKAAVGMAAAFLRCYRGRVRGVVVTPYGHGGASGQSLPGVDVIEAGHPVPDGAGLDAGARVLGLLRDLGPDDLVIGLLSGGGSALLVQPAAGVTLADKQSLTRQLLASGATIAEINCVRRKLSAVKGGWLARAAFPARVSLLAISDVPGDAIADIASGPFSPDPTSLEEARDVLRRYGCRVSDAVAARLANPACETPKPSDPVFAGVSATICARSADALAAAGACVAAAGFEPVLLDDRVNGPAHALAAAHARLARQYQRAGRRVALVSGGETTVVVRNAAGRGGRNTEYLLALGVDLDGAPGIWALAADTDGIDGHADSAGAILRPDSLQRAAELAMAPREFLAANRSGDFFAALDDLVTTGPTGTNANDLRILLVG